MMTKAKLAKTGTNNAKLATRWEIKRQGLTDRSNARANNQILTQN